MKQPFEATATGSCATLLRVLTLRDLLFYGLVLMQPIAPVGIFGLSQKISHGHVVTTVLIAMVAMMLTAFSYGRLATVHPSAGSAYTYVSRELNPHLDFLVGWAMSLDYLMIPLINTIFGSLTLYRLLPQIPYAAWVALFVGVITVLNLRGIKSVAHTDTVLLAIMTLVIIIFIVQAIHYLARSQGWGEVFSFKPFYDRASFDVRSIGRATSLAALTYVGFDAVTTLAEEVHQPKRTVPLATVLVCLLTGLYSSVEVYVGQLVWPNYLSFPNLETAFLDVTRRVGGPLLRRWEPSSQWLVSAADLPGKSAPPGCFMVWAATTCCRGASSLISMQSAEAQATTSGLRLC